MPAKVITKISLRRDDLSGNLNLILCFACKIAAKNAPKKLQRVKDVNTSEFDITFFIKTASIAVSTNAKILYLISFLLKSSNENPSLVVLKII